MKTALIDRGKQNTVTNQQSIVQTTDAPGNRENTVVCEC